MIERLVRVLAAARLDLTAEDIADALWLAELMRGGAPVSPPGPAQPCQEPEEKQPQSREKTRPERTRPRSERAGTESRAPLVLPGSGATSAVPLKVPAAAALPRALELGRALRPLHRRVPSRRAHVVDEAASAEQIAETGIWAPVLRPEQTRWLDLALVVDAGASMAVWQRTVAELRDLLQYHGAFRNVRVWRMAPDAGEGPLLLRPGLEEGPGVLEASSPQLLVDPSGRQLVLVVSDCVSRRWHTGEVGAMLAEWGRAGPVAVVQLLPEALWGRTALRNGTSLVLRTRQPAAANTRLLAAQSQRRSRAAPAEAAPVFPVVPLEPGAMGAWAQLVAGGATPVRGFELRRANRLPPSPTGARPAPSASERVERFFATASAPARKLAGLLAASPPVNLPVLRLIRETLVPEADHGHIAEVYLGGLLRELPEQPPSLSADARQYDFWPGVRERLLDTVPAGSAWTVLRQVSEFIAERLGQTRDFSALLVDPSKDAGPFVQRNRAFASIAAPVLQGLGGDYVDLARRLREADRLPGPDTDPEALKLEFSEAGEQGPAEHTDDDSALSSVQDAGDWAIVIGVSQRRGDTAERDAHEFHAWLTSPLGGGVPSSQATLLLTPTLSEAEHALNRLISNALSWSKAGLVGDRLYFFATGPGVNRDVLSLGRPTRANEAPLFARDYAKWFAETGVFREVFLIMDCGPTLIYPFRSDQRPQLPRLPTDSRPPGDLLFAHAVNRDLLEPSQAEARGPFSEAMLEGLKGGAADPEGVLTAGTLLTFVSSWMRDKGLPAPVFEHKGQGQLSSFILAKHSTLRQTEVQLRFHPIYRGLTATIFDEKYDDVASNKVTDAPWDVLLPPGTYTLTLSARAVTPLTFTVREHAESVELEWEHSGKWVLVAGSGEEPLSKREQWLCAAIGDALALAGHQAVTGDQPGVDAAVIRAYAARMAPWAAEAIQETPGTSLPDHDIVKGMRLIPGSEGYDTALRLADAVVLIGGGSGVRTLYERLQPKGKTILPIRAAGGESARIFDQLWAQAGDALRDQLEALGEPVTTREEAESLVELLVTLIQEAPGSIAELPEDRWAWAGPVAKDFRHFAAEYEQLRAQFPSGGERIRHLNRLVAQVRRRAWNLIATEEDINRMLPDASPGERIVLLAILQASQSAVCFDAVLRVLAQSLSPFEQLAALRVMREHLVRLTPEQLLSLSRTLRGIQSIDSLHLARDSFRRGTIDRLLKDIDRELTISGSIEVPAQLRSGPEEGGETVDDGSIDWELEDVAEWFEDSIARWQALADTLPPRHKARLQHGYYAVGYQLIGEIRTLEGEALREALAQGVVKHTGWPPFWVPTRPEIAPYMAEDNLECWLGPDGEKRDPSESDFWRASPRGQLFLLRGHQEDGTDNPRESAGTVFDVSLPAWRTGEILLHAASMARQFGAPQARIVLIAEWTGLAHRELVSIPTPQRPVPPAHRARQDRYRTSLTVQANQISETLPKLVDQLIRPLYLLFDAYELPATLVSEELAKLLSDPWRR